jgi:hypothetical protein
MRTTCALVIAALLLAIGCEGKPLGSSSGNRPVAGGTGSTDSSVVTGGDSFSGQGHGGTRASTAGAGGMASTGRVAATGGASGGTCTTLTQISASNCDTPRTGVGSLLIDWYYPYIEAPFQGFPYVFISPSSNPSDTLLCPDNPYGSNGARVPGSSWCGAGTIPADCTGNTVAGIGFNLNQPQWGYGTLANGNSQPTDPISNPARVAKVAVSFSNRANSDLRIQIAQHSDSGPLYYCSDITRMASPVTVATSHFTKTCWDSTSPGVVWDGTGAESIALIIPGQTSKPTAFDACLQQVEFH